MSMSSHTAEPALNATPLIDVLLVLLIMLIFTIPVMTHKVAVTLPQHPPRGDLPEVIELGIDFDGLVTWNGKPVESLAQLENRLRAEQAKIPAPTVFLRADPRARYEGAVQVLAATQRAHVTNLAIVGLARL
jgi:biopolymer transport protein ExbD